MIKRTMNITSLLVAATSIVSMVPAMAVDQASVTDALNATLKNVEAQEGTFYYAKELEQGVYCVDAELNGEERAVYLWQNGKFNKLIDGGLDGKIEGQYVYNGTKYILILKDDNAYNESYYNDQADEEGSNFDYCINETTGEKVYDNMRKNINHDASRVLKSKIKKDNGKVDDGRFAESNFNGNTVMSLKDIGLGNCFYYTLNKAKVNGDTKSVIYTDTEGNYIDGDYNLGQVGVITTGASVQISNKEVVLQTKTINIRNTEDTYTIKGMVDGVEKTYKLKAAITTRPPQVAYEWGKVYGYHNGTVVNNYTQSGVIRTAELSIWIKENDAPDSEYTNITDKVEYGRSNNHHKVPTKTANDYAHNQGTYIPVLQKIVRVPATDTINGIKYSNDASTYFETDSDGNEYDSDKFLGIISAYASYDIKTDSNGKWTGFKGQTINLKSKNGYNYVDAGDVDEVDIDGSGAVDWSGWMGYGCVSTDGFVEVFNPAVGKFEKKYRVDRTMNNMESTMTTDVIVWNKDQGIYSITTNPTSTQGQTVAVTNAATTNTDTTATTTGAAIKIGWSKNNDGTWSNIKADGSKVTGWLKDGTAWYYLKSDGIMATGWINDNGIWYYCNTSGEMLANTTVDGYALGANGALIN